MGPSEEDSGLSPTDIHGEGVVAPSYRLVTYGAGDLPIDFLGLVLSKWMRSLRYGNDYFKLMRADDFYRTYQLIIKQLLLKASVRMAVLSDDADVVLGFSVFRGQVLDYVHVHEVQRKQGIGRRLVPADVTTITHLTKTGLAIWANKCPELIFNPFA